MLIEKAKKPVILDCNCWQCPTCYGSGVVTTAYKKREDCEQCSGLGQIKLCHEHAMSMQWLSKK